ncbi:MAG: tRNA-dihydrouridine synthase [Candidatus Peribacteraceae bacterium]|nr:tRNA-dihydrouridine synthase [Candidatus Peribacteraceae bacterium]
MPFSWLTAPRPLVCLAPMAGVTDASYRRFIKKLAPETILYSEFLCTDALAYGGKKTMEMMHFDPALERPFIVQVFGKRPEHFVEAAKVIEQMGADGIDINMGCPAAKVVSSAHGSALMKNPDLAAELVARTVQAVSIPVSVKTRLGWDTAETLVPFCRRLVEAGAAALAVHGRRYCDKFTGAADWEPIYELKKQVSVPVIGNGDIKSGADAVAKIGNLDGVMVGRATFGNPWVMKEVCDALCSLTPNPSPIGGGGRPRTFAETIPFILEHCALAAEVKGEKRGMMEMRRHLASYVKGFQGAAELRAKLVRVESIAEVEDILRTVAGSV